MPGESGLDLARDLKSISNIPICMLTARAEPEQRIEGLEAGVDDYVAKPFEPRELLLRLQNILQARQGALRPARRDHHGRFHLPRRARRAQARRGIHQADRARARPAAPVRAAARACRSRATSWPADESTGTERAIDVQINRLRRKIESDPANPVYLQTVRGKGYILYTD